MRKIYLVALLIFFKISAVTAQSIDYTTPLYTDASFGKIIDKLLPVGSIQGAGGVGSGAATYSIPISLPPGTNGVSPNLSLEYNSMGANDFLGAGWNMSALSSINRSGQNIYYDGKVTSVDLSGNDRFTLDGQRLIGVTGTYGGNSATYATESESFSVTTSYGTTGSGPTYFKVISKDGTEMEFGNTTDSRIGDQSNSNILSWRLNKIKYPDGNYITFSYTFDAASDRDSRIDEINYTGNDAAGIAPYNKIKFSYKVRADINTQYVAGSSLTNKYLLDKITVTAESATVQTYEFGYGWDNVNSYLREIFESGSDGIKLNSTRFKYGDIPVELTTGSTTIPSGNDIQSFTGDYNGDGAMDLLTATTDHSDTYGFDYINQFKTWKRDPATGSYSLLATQNLPTTSSYVIENKAIPTVKGPSPLDVNGDGLDDVVVLGIQYVPTGGGFNRLNEITHYESNSTGTGFTTRTQSYPVKGGVAYSKIPTNGKFFFQGDFDGDGITEYVVMLGNESDSNYGIFFYDNVDGQPNAFTEVIQFPTSSSSTRTDWYTAKISQVMDFNGDGKSDLMLIWDTGAEIFSFDSPGIARSIYQSATFPSASQFLYYGDFNADGKTDMVTASLDFTTVTKAISTGTGFSQSALVLTQPWPSSPASEGGNNELIVGDYNGDGKSDLYYYWFRVINYPTSEGNETHTIYGTDLYYSQGDAFKYKQLSYLEEIQQPGRPTTVTTIADSPVDLNGDGRTDLISSGGNTLSFRLFNKDGKDNYLQKVSNGYNHITQWTYQSLASGGSFYSKGSGTSSYPLNILQPALNLVSELKADNGISGFSTIQYTYEGARFHRGGKGFLGLGKVTSSDLSSGMSSVSENEFNTTYFAAAPKKNSAYLTAGNVLLTETTLVNEYVAQGATGSKRFLYRLKSSAENNVFEGRTLNSSNDTFDNFGNVKQSTVNNNNIETTVTSTNYSAYVTAIDNSPTSVTITKTRSGQPAFSVNTAFDYYSNGQLKTKTNFNGLSKKVITDYEYHAAGYLKKTTVTGYEGSTALAARVNSAVFDSKGRYPETTTNELNQSSSATYDARWGKPLTTTGVNGLTTTNQYDGFGRLKQTTLPGSPAYTVVQTYGWGQAGEPLWYDLVSHPGRPDVKTWHDVLGRQVKTETEAYPSGLITQTQSYDARGNVSASTQPYKSSESFITTSTQYDTYNRPFNINSGVLGTTTVGYSYASGNLTVTSAAPTGTTSKTTDATGQVISATDNGGTLSYTYYSHGGLKDVKNGGTTLTSNEYDEYGRQTKLIDANAGTTQYVYDALGQLISQLNANGQTHTMLYDVVGRNTTRTGPEGTTGYEYYPDGSGASTNQIKMVTGFSGNLQEFTYDGLGRLVTLKETVDDTPYTTGYGYNTYGDLATTSYPSGFGTTQAYDANGYPTTIHNNSGGSLYSTGSINSLGQVTTYALGNGKSSSIDYTSGFSTRYLTAGVQDLNMVWDYTTGNLTSRSDAVKNKTESFIYDNLNRLKTTTIGSTSLTINYAANGNIDLKPDAGTFSYHPTKFNAVIGVTNPSPSPIPVFQQDISYTAFMQPNVVTENASGGVTYELTYTYGADYERIKGVTINKQNNSVLNTRYYFGGYEKDITGAVTKYIQYVSSPVGLIAIVTSEGAVHTPHFVYTDHLGSILTVTNGAGTVEAEQSFDAWGRRRDPGTWALLPPTAAIALPDWLYRGYTGHEHLDHFGLINMNGRMYDPVVGRVLSPDNYVQNAFGTQDYNRYSYANNNPLTYNDPSGELVFFIPHISFGKGGLSIGLEIGIGVPGILSASVTGGYNFKSNVGYWSIQGSAFGLYAGYGSSGGFAGFGYRYSGLSAGVGYGSSGWSVGVSYGATSGNFSGSLGVGWSQKGGFDWNTSGGYTYYKVANQNSTLGSQSAGNGLMASSENSLDYNGERNVPGGSWDLWGEGYVPYQGDALGGTNFVGPGPNFDPYTLFDPRNPGNLLTPIDRIDEAAQIHDDAYYKAATGGIRGAIFNLRVRHADAVLMLKAQKIMSLYGRGGGVISPRTFNIARAVFGAFAPITISKYYTTWKNSF